MSFMFTQPQPYPETIDLMSCLKARYKLKVAAVSNEGGELKVCCSYKFKPCKLLDFFVSPYFVHIRKPDEDICRLALTCVQVIAEEAIG
jgi:putative hydrolase of the HAD superfamily